MTTITLQKRFSQNVITGGASILSQEVIRGGQALFDELSLNMEYFYPNKVVDIPAKLESMLSRANLPTNAWLEKDKFKNLVLVYLDKDGEEVRVACAIALTHKDEILLQDRTGLPVQNVNERYDIFGAIGFALPSFFAKLPEALVYKKITKVSLVDFMGTEHTDGNGDKAQVKMPTILCELDDIAGAEEFFIPVSEIPDTLPLTSKAQAAVAAMHEKM